MRVMIDRLEPEVHNALVFLRQHPEQAFTVKEIGTDILPCDKLLDFYKYAMVTDVLDYATIFGEIYFIIKDGGKKR